mmetsp:Transcript_7166/g.17257  ORF Transcript_7166/g.17257 Transcript_7166/m.17257 type:complete len:90 (-) Transcript_7166:391-660(-)
MRKGCRPIGVRITPSMDVGGRAGRAGGGPYGVLLEKMGELKEQAEALSGLQSQLLDQNAKVCLATTTGSFVARALSSVAASAPGRAQRP